MTVFDLLYDGLNTGWVTPEDLDPDLAAIEVWVRFVGPCGRSHEGDCGHIAVHEFAADATSCIYARCDPDGAVPDTTTDVVAVRFLWPNGQAQVIGPAHVPYLHPILARLQPS